MIKYCDGDDTSFATYTTLLIGTDSKTQTVVYIKTEAPSSEIATTTAGNFEEIVATTTADFEAISVITSGSEVRTITVTVVPQSSQRSSTSSEPTTIRISSSESASP